MRWAVYSLVAAALLFLCWSGWEGAAASVPGTALPHYGPDRLRRRLLHAAAATSPVAAAAPAFVVEGPVRRDYVFFSQRNFTISPSLLFFVLVLILPRYREEIKQSRAMKPLHEGSGMLLFAVLAGLQVMSSETAEFHRTVPGSLCSSVVQFSFEPSRAAVGPRERETRAAWGKQCYVAPPIKAALSRQV